MPTSQEQLSTKAQNLLRKLISNQNWLASNKESKFRPLVEKQMITIQDNYWKCLRKINESEHKS